MKAGWPEAIAKVLFQTCDLFVADQPEAFSSTHSQSSSTLDNTRETLAWQSLESFLCVLPIFFVCFTILVLDVQPTPQGKAGASAREKGGYRTCGGAALTW